MSTQNLPYFLIIFFTLVCSTSNASPLDRPFWTEKSAYIEGNIFYAIGVASNAQTIEAGRQIAFQNGVREMLNYAQITEIGTLAIETQMTYEELTQQNSYNVFRLLKVNLNQLIKIKRQLKNVRKPSNKHTYLKTPARLHQQKVTATPTNLPQRRDTTEQYNFWLVK